MTNGNFKIAVTGDLSANSLFWKTKNEQEKELSWQHYPIAHDKLIAGEALFLSELVSLATGAEVLSPLMKDKEIFVHKGILISRLELDLFPATGAQDDRKKVYRVSRFNGFTGPDSGVPGFFPVIDDDADVDMVILDDENNGFSSNDQFWPSALKTAGRSPFVIFKTNKASSSNKLWKHLQEFHREKTVVVINGDDMRSIGVNISKGLSWERTALDFVWQINNNPDISFLANCSHLIIPFGVEGAIYYKNDGSPESKLFFLTYEFEGEMIKESQGKMYGMTSCFVAGLAQAVVSGIKSGDDLGSSLTEGIREGLVASQKYFVRGFGENLEDFSFPDPAIFVEGEDDFVYKEHIQDVTIGNTEDIDCLSCWYIIKEKGSANLTEIAYDIVENGAKSALKYIPIATFGNLKTVDRTEIEAYRSIKKLMSEYISTQNTVRPLSIAVFGTPGSGKSFGVTEVASSIDPKLIEKLNFNLSQFKSQTELTYAFHRVRDLSLEGKVPLVFFDEFDSAFEGKLGWLKYLLAPMQDGVFREGDSLHPLGKSIFVFAGGTSSTFDQFCGEDIGDEREHIDFYREFQGAKGPDFVSRLRGYVNILGPNQTDEQKDQLFIIRRAMLLRTLLQRKVPHLINERGEAQVDKGVLRALLMISRYKHESRSMEAILEMSMLTGAKKWEQSDLPSKEQLKLHVDEEEFYQLLMQEAFESKGI